MTGKKKKNILKKLSNEELLEDFDYSIRYECAEDYFRSPDYLPCAYREEILRRLESSKP